MKEWSNVIYHKVKSPFIKACLYLGISANHVTLFNHLITLTFGCWGFSRGTHEGMWIGLGVCLINGFLDYLDGDLARETGRLSKLGVWLDSGFDVIIQFAVMGAIAVGCFKMGLSIWWVVLFFIALGANNFVSFNYNQTFGFDSDKGNSLFRELMDRKGTPVNVFLKNLIDPTSSYLGLVAYTYRYFILFGVVLGVLPVCFMAFTIIGNIKWLIMYTIYALHLMESKKLYVNHVLAALDEEREDFFRLRNNGNL